jgi:hypothetical protein
MIGQAEQGRAAHHLGDVTPGHEPAFSRPCYVAPACRRHRLGEPAWLGGMRVTGPGLGRWASAPALGRRQTSRERAFLRPRQLGKHERRTQQETPSAPFGAHAILVLLSLPGVGLEHG